MNRETIEKANEIIKKIKKLEKEIEHLEDYIIKGTIVYFERHPDYGCGLKFSDPLVLTAEEIQILIAKRKESINKLEKKLEIL